MDLRPSVPGLVPTGVSRRRPGLLAGKGGLETAEEAFHLLRQAPPRIWAAYAIGTIPFVLNLLYFWADMSRSAYAAGHAVGAALGLALTFVWMKSWQSVFAVELRAHAAGAPPPSWPWRRLARLVLVQAAFQPPGLVAIPAALCLAVPFPAVHAFFQNVTVLGDGATAGLRDSAGKALRQASLWPRQNLILIWLVSPWLLGAGLLVAFGSVWLALSVTPELYAVSGRGWFMLGAVIVFNLVMPLAPLGCVVAGNVAILLVALPQLWQALTGEQTVLALSGFYAFINTTFLTTVFALTYLVLDPLTKAAYVLRCFHGESVTTGEDLRVELRPFRAGALSGRLSLGILAAGLLTLASGVCAATPPAADAAGRPTSPVKAAAGNPADREREARLEASIDEVLARPDYAWRMPREGLGVDPDSPSLWGQFFRKLAQQTREWLASLVRLLRKLDHWMRRFLPHREANPAGDLAWQSTIQTMLFVLLAVSASVLAVLVLRAWKRHREAPRRLTATPVVTAEALLKDEVVADRLPSDEWMALARELLGRGETRLALRAMFLGALAHLAQAGRLTVARGKSNREYRRELERKAHDRPELLEAFIRNVGLVERVWYGAHPATDELVARFQSNQALILGQPAGGRMTGSGGGEAA